MSCGGDSLRRRKRIDTETSSLHGSEISLFEPLQVDVSTPSTNTVILTPSKITIEHSSDYEGARDKKPTANGRTQAKRNRYVSSPVQWTCGHGTDDAKDGKNRTDFIEIISEPEDMYRSRSSSNHANTSKATGTRVNNGIETTTQKKPSPYNDPNAYSVWEMAKENNERTFIFHHKSDVGDKCCDNYCPRIESETDIEVGSGDRSFTKNPDEESSQNNEKINCCNSMSSLAQLDQLNNSMPATSMVAGTNHSTALTNFQKNNISQSASHRLIDLSSDIRRYSKITNFEQQNASNLLPNYLSRSSNANLNELPPPPPLPAASAPAPSSSTGTSFELFNMPSTSMYDKPFGSIHLTTQNHFESPSSSGKFSMAHIYVDFNG